MLQCLHLVDMMGIPPFFSLMSCSSCCSDNNVLWKGRVFVFVFVA